MTDEVREEDSSRWETRAPLYARPEKDGPVEKSESRRQLRVTDRVAHTRPGRAAVSFSRGWNREPVPRDT